MIDPIDEAKGRAFEWLVGLAYQHLDHSSYIVPQGRLPPPLNGSKSSIYVDFYRYDPQKQDGEIVEVKWRCNEENLNCTINDIMTSLKEHSLPLNSGEHININPVKEARKIILVTNRKIGSYKHDSIYYLTLQELIDESPSRLWPIKVMNENLSERANERDLKAVTRLEELFYRVFMEGFETGYLPDLEDLAHEYFFAGAKRLNILKKDLKGFYKPKVRFHPFGVANRGPPYYSPRIRSKRDIAREISICENLIYLRRKL